METSTTIRRRDQRREGTTETFRTSREFRVDTVRVEAVLSTSVQRKSPTKSGPDGHVVDGPWRGHRRDPPMKWEMTNPSETLVPDTGSTKIRKVVVTVTTKIVRG